MPGKKFIKKGKKAKGLGKTKSTTTYGKGGAKKKYKAGGSWLDKVRKLGSTNRVIFISRFR